MRSLLLQVAWAVFLSKIPITLTQFSKVISMNLKSLQNLLEWEGIPWRSYCIYTVLPLLTSKQSNLYVILDLILLFLGNCSVLQTAASVYHTLNLWAKNTNTDCVSRWEWCAYCTQYYKREVTVLSVVWLILRRHITDEKRCNISI